MGARVTGSMGARVTGSMGARVTGFRGRDWNRSSRVARRKGNALSDLGGGGGALGLDAERGLDARLGALGVARGQCAGLRVVRKRDG